MQLLTLACGIVIGILVRDIKIKTIKIAEKIKENYETKDFKSQFIEPVSFKERFEESENLDELLD